MHAQRILVALLAVCASDAQASCEEPSTNADLVDAMEQAKIALGELEIEDFNAAVDTATEKLACVGEPLSLATAAEFHRVTGLAAFLRRNSPEAQRRFAAARAIQPSYVFPTDMVPEGNPILDDYGALDPEKGPFVVVRPPAEGSLRLDGSVALKRNEPLPLLFQRLDASGGVVETAWVESGAVLPAYPMAPTTEPVPPKSGKGPNKPLLIAAGASVGLAGGLYGAGLASRGGYDRSDSLDGLDAKRARTNTLVISSGIVGAAAIGLGASSFLLSGTF